jgi:alpha-mannosidase
VREINAAEEAIGPFSSTGGELLIDLKPYQPRTFSISRQPGSASIPARSAAPLNLSFNLDGISTDANRADGDFDGKRQSIAGELLPARLMLDGVPFNFGPASPGALNVLVPRGQELALPQGSFNRLYVLAAAVGGDLAATFTIGGPAAGPKPVQLTVRDWEGPVGQWDSRLKDAHLFHEVYAAPMRGQSWTPDAIQSDMVVKWDPQTGAVSGLDQIRPGFVKRDEIAWVGTHRHAPDGNQPYIPTYVFAYAIDLPAGTRGVTLPDNAKIRILAMTVVADAYRVRSAGLLYASDLLMK